MKQRKSDLLEEVGTELPLYRREMGEKEEKGALLLESDAGVWALADFLELVFVKEY